MLDCMVNGELSQVVEASDRGLNYGDGLFETIAVEQGRPRYWADHMQRLASGCQRLALPMPHQAVLLREATTVSHGQSRCIVKICLTRGPGARGYRPSASTAVNRIVSAHAWPEGIEALWKTGVAARICRMRLALQPALGGIKHLNRLEQVLASMEWDDPAIHEGILLDTEGYVISAVSANIFLVSSGTLLTPRMDRCGVRGILRGRILKAFAKRCELRRVTPDMFAEADEVFLASTVRGILPVCRIDTQTFPPGPVTRSLQEWLAQDWSNQ